MKKTLRRLILLVSQADSINPGTRLRDYLPWPQVLLDWEEPKNKE